MGAVGPVVARTEGGGRIVDGAQIEGLEALVRGAEDACRHADRARYQNSLQTTYPTTTVTTRRSFRLAASFSRGAMLGTMTTNRPR
eukprot:779915-Pyramimonas_sp.AAC.2